MISKNMKVQINLLFSLISIDPYPVSKKRRFDVFRRCLVLVGPDLFAISNFCTAGIRYLEHLLTRTFWPVLSRFETTIVDCKRFSYVMIYLFNIWFYLMIFDSRSFITFRKKWLKISEEEEIRIQSKWKQIGLF